MLVGLEGDHHSQRPSVDRLPPDRIAPRGVFRLISVLRFLVPTAFDHDLDLQKRDLPFLAPVPAVAGIPVAALFEAHAGEPEDIRVLRGSPGPGLFPHEYIVTKLQRRSTGEWIVAMMPLDL